MQEELLQFKLQEVWVLCDLPEGKRVIGTKWVFRNKRDERGTIIKNKARLVAQGYRHEKMDVQEWHSYMAIISKKCMSNQLQGFDDQLIQTKSTELRGSSMVKDFEDLMQKEFKMSSMGELTFFLGLQVKQSNGGKDEEGEDVDVHLYRSMIGCLMYLTASRPDIMFAVCLCARFQVTPVTMLGTIHDRRSKLQVGCQYPWKEDWFFGNARNKQLWLFLTEAEYVAAAVVVLSERTLDLRGIIERHIAISDSVLYRTALVSDDLL
ncbi:putative ribonuclease H-like domain-containing protein [Tanacetum coccineum]|uniref:Ribonuclease H-like domain-containing protein n=1 Tax=Tanacetum coccineum TaxID=301880 RepID=A0ABQ5BVV5_9ASTR